MRRVRTSRASEWRVLGRATWSGPFSFGALTLWLFAPIELGFLPCAAKQKLIDVAAPFARDISDSVARVVLRQVRALAQSRAAWLSGAAQCARESMYARQGPSRSFEDGGRVDFSTFSNALKIERRG